MASPVHFFKDYISNIYGIEKENIKTRNSCFKKSREEYDEIYALSKKPLGRASKPFSKQDRPFQILYDECLRDYKNYIDSIKRSGGVGENAENVAAAAAAATVVDPRCMKTVFINLNLKRIDAFRKFFYSGFDTYSSSEMGKMYPRENGNEEEEGEGDEGKEKREDEEELEEEEEEGEVVDNKKVDKSKEIKKRMSKLFTKFVKRIRKERKTEKCKKCDFGGEYDEDPDSDLEFDEFDDVSDIWKNDILFIKMKRTPFEEIPSIFEDIKKESERRFPYLNPHLKESSKSKKTTTTTTTTTKKSKKKNDNNNSLPRSKIISSAPVKSSQKGEQSKSNNNNTPDLGKKIVNSVVVGDDEETTTTTTTTIHHRPDKLIKKMRELEEGEIIDSDDEDMEIVDNNDEKENKKKYNQQERQLERKSSKQHDLNQKNKEQVLNNQVLQDKMMLDLKRTLKERALKLQMEKEEALKKIKSPDTMKRKRDSKEDEINKENHLGGDQPPNLKKKKYDIEGEEEEEEEKGDIEEGKTKKKNKKRLF